MTEAVALAPGLWALALRRALPPRLVIPLAVVAVLGLLHARGGAELLPDDVEGAALRRAFARQGTWTLLALVLPLPFCLHAAGLATRWRRRDAAWLAPRAVRRGAALAWGWAGIATAGIVLALGAALVAELAARGDGPSLRHAGTLHTPAATLLEPGASIHWELEDPRLAALPPGSRLRLRPSALPGAGPTSRLLVAAHGELLRSPDWEPPLPDDVVAAQVSRRTVVDVSLPEGLAAPALSLGVARISGAGAFLPANGVDLLVPTQSERVASVELMGRLSLALAAWSAVAIGLGAWLRPSLAAAGTLCLWLLLWCFGFGVAWFPGGDLPASVALLGEGLVAPRLPLSQLVGLAACVVFGLVLARAGLESEGASA